MENIERQSREKDLHIDFSRSSKEEKWNGIYADEGKLMVLLGGKDYCALDMVSPFMGMFADRCCNETSTAVTTHLFVSYVDVMQISLFYNAYPTMWNEERLKKLQGKINLFKNQSVSLYAKHKASALRTK